MWCVIAETRHRSMRSQDAMVRRIKKNSGIKSLLLVKSISATTAGTAKIRHDRAHTQLDTDNGTKMT